MIRSTFASFSIARMGMQASQRALDITGQNIANINTPGYTRQRVDQVSFNLTNGSYMNATKNTDAGYGVWLTGISQVRDPYLDIQYRGQIDKVGTADAMQGVLDSLGKVFDETDQKALKDALSNFSSSLDQLSNNSSKEQENIVRSRLKVLTDLLHQKATNLEGVRTETQKGLEETDIPNLNKLLKEIGDLNETIYNSEVLGNPALELKDTRNSKLDELASYVSINVTYGSKALSTDTTVTYPKVSLVGKDGTIIDDLFSGDHNTEVGSFATEIAEVTGKVSLVYKKAGDAADAPGTDITDTLKDGTLRGTLDMLNESGSLDEPPTNTKGIGYYEKALNSFVDNFAKTFNQLNSLKDKDGNVAEQYDLFSTSDNSANFTAANIKISDDWMNNVTGIIQKGEVEEGTAGNTNILRMIAALSEKRDFKVEDKTLYSGSFEECYTTTLEGNQAIDSSSNTSLLNNYIDIVNATQNNRDSISAVSLDEEAVNILQYQRSYSAAARFMTALDEVLDTLINSTGVVGR